MKITTTLFISLILSCQFLTAQVNLDWRLVASYPFNGNANDESVNGNHGTVYGATLTFDRFGNPNCAYSFDGINDYIISKIDKNISNFTYSVWFKTSKQGVIVTNSQMSDLTTGIGDKRIYIDNSGRIICGVYSTGVFSIKSTTSYNDNLWHNAVLTQDDNSFSLYVDNMLIGTNNKVSMSPTDQWFGIGYSFLIGDWPNLPSINYFNGSIDDIRVYNRALNATEIQTLSSPCLERDSLALVALYNATDGPNWTRNDNWLTGPVNSWWGIKTDGCNVTEIILNIDRDYQNHIFRGNNLIGTLPLEIFNLNKLKVLNLTANQLTGTIPPEIGDLVEIEELLLHQNQFSGTIPAELWNLVNLRTLVLSNNLLTGKIAPEIKNLINLQDLRLDLNKLTGAIPNEIGNLAKLAVLWLDNNQLTGRIPVEIGNLSKLNQLMLCHNQLTGSIPSEIGNLVELIYIKLEGNQLTGFIPSSISNLKSLFLLGLESNQFSGEIPDGISTLSSLKFLMFRDNYFDEIPNLLLVDSITCSYNQLTFEDFERNLNTINNPSISFNYSPQRLFSREYDTTAIEGNPFALSILCGGKFNHYKWLKDGIKIIGTHDSSTLSFTTIQDSDTGIYHITVTNDSVPNLTLQSFPVHLKILNKPVLSSFDCNSVNQPLTLSLEWDYTTWANSYAIQVSTTPDFTLNIIDTTGITTNHLIINNLEYSAKYYWHVNASNAYGTSGWSEVCNFITLPPPPDELKPINLVVIDGSNNPNFIIENIEDYPENNLVIYTKWGKLVYEKTGYNNELDFSTYPEGTYYYVLTYLSNEGEKQIKNFVDLIKKN